MKKLMLIALMALPTTAFAVENPGKFEAYKQRRAQRHAYALEARRAYNANKGPHVYRTAAALNVKPFIAIEQGWVPQPPIPVIVRPVIGWPYYGPTQHTSHVHHYPVYDSAATATVKPARAVFRAIR